MIDQKSVNKVWFPSREEIQDYISKRKKFHINEKTLEIVKEEYYKTIEGIKIEERGNTCPNCNDNLIKKPGRDFYVCPNWRPNGNGCKGYIIGEWEYEKRKKFPYKIKRNSPGWVERLNVRLNREGLKEITKRKLSYILKELNLKSPSKIEKEYIEKWERREWGGDGFKTAKKNSDEQEKLEKEKLIETYGEENVLYQPWIFYTYQGNNYIYSKRPDFIVYNKEFIIIFECKLWDWDKDESQKQDYIFLLNKLYPNKTITFQYIIKNDTLEEEPSDWF